MTPPSVPPFDDEARAGMKRWVDEWRRVGPLLEARRVAELRRLSEEEAARIAVELLWPMARIGEGDAGEGLTAMRDALRRLASRP